MKPIEFSVLGTGAWGNTFRNWAELIDVLRSGRETRHEEEGPKPEIIPANERRRAPLPVRLAVETSWQAVQQSKVDAKDLASVFVSGLGDTQLTDYMCKVLASENKALSPTKFHNSVHNAAAGYWTISTGCMQAANSVAGFQQSVPLCFMEALIQSVGEHRPLLLSFYDAPCSKALLELLHNDQPFAASLVIAPKQLGINSNAPSFMANLVHEPNATIKQSSSNFSSTKTLQDLFAVNPAAQILPFLKLLSDNPESDTATVSMSLSSATQFSVQRC